MEFKIEDIEGTFRGEIIENFGNNEYIIKLNDKEHNLKIVNMDFRGIEILLDQKYHRIKYLDIGTSKQNLIVNGIPFTINLHANLDEIVYKNSGTGGTIDSELALRSQIPGKVISIAVHEGTEIKKGDKVCVLESMKMQVSIKSHKDGIVKKIKIKEGATVAKNDVIAEIE
jgi:biotin carboxyl carrier protein